MQPWAVGRGRSGSVRDANAPSCLSWAAEKKHPGIGQRASSSVRIGAQLPNGCRRPCCWRCVELLDEEDGAGRVRGPEIVAKG
jgi:hypothetical protein